MKFEDRYERVEVTSRQEWRDWLATNHNKTESIWLVTYKKAAGDKYVSYEDTVEEALYFGWIDSRPAKLDDLRTMLLFSPRKPKSVWSDLNNIRIERLIASGLMTEAGMSKIRQAQADGSWDTLTGTDSEPEGLTAALAANPAARENWDNFPPSSRKAILQWIHSAKTTETLQKRIAETVELAARSIRANFPKNRAAYPSRKP